MLIAFSLNKYRLVYTIINKSFWQLLADKRFGQKLIYDDISGNFFVTTIKLVTNSKFGLPTTNKDFVLVFGTDDKWLVSFL